MSNLPLADFLKYNINNIGDPFHPNSGINTCDFEQEVISFWSAALHLDSANAWGYITNGSTEGIMYGISQGRNRYE
ncbi:MAG: histidine decarboxylase, partial [Synechococcaceae bacterium WB8_1B_057]|nr:histidine decarboxylase [Synechococcaceae bacterium WB8_1B_057]